VYSVVDRKFLSSYEGRENNISLAEEFVSELPHNHNEEFNTERAEHDTADDIVPKVHMCFDSLAAVKKFYGNYAIIFGFGIRTRTSTWGEDNEINYVKLVCSREGNYVSVIPPKLKTIPSKRKECKALITIAKKEGQWFIRKIVTKYSHDISQKKSRLIRDNRKVDMHVRQTVDINDEVGIRINKSFRSLVCEVEGYENVNFIKRDVHNYIGQQKRTLCKDGDGQASLRHFSQMRKLNNEFFFDIDMDEKNKICNYFLWMQ